MTKIFLMGDISVPKVSVLMPVYNTFADHLREAIDSVLNQSYKDFELILLNDASTDDNVEKIIHSYKDERIIYIKNEKNLGISPTRNKLVELAKGEYLAIMDHDDISLPNRFSKQVEFLDNNRDYGVVGSWHGVIGRKVIKKLPVDNDLIEKTLLVKCCICHPASMIRKSVLSENNLIYNKDCSPAEDYDLWCNLIGKTQFYNIPENLFMYRDHDTNTSHRQRDKMSEITSKIQCSARKKNFQIWDSIQDNVVEVFKIKLFNFLPLLTIKSRLNKSRWNLFGFIPLFSTKRKFIKKVKL